MAKEISLLSQNRINGLNMKFKSEYYDDIEKFINGLSEEYKFKGLKLSNFVESKYMFLYGPGMLSLELFQVLALNMIIAFNGVYLNNQRLIEKIVGNEMVEFNNTI